MTGGVSGAASASRSVPRLYGRRWAGKTLTRLARTWMFVDADESDLGRVVR
jgi:hypothetical protein